jgi:hypothetical protein
MVHTNDSDIIMKFSTMSFHIHSSESPPAFVTGSEAKLRGRWLKKRRALSSSPDANIQPNNLASWTDKTRRMPSFRLVGGIGRDLIARYPFEHGRR